MPFQLYSPAFNDGETIPQRFTCDGGDRSPPLLWSDPPAGTASFVLVCFDPDAPRGTWYHWGVWNIPADARSLPEHLPTLEQTGGLQQAINDFGRPGYGGPCPPPRHRAHRYIFRLLALRIPRLEINAQTKCRDLEAAYHGHILSEAVLTGMYARSQQGAQA